jgi:dihydrofolate reductase
MTSQFDAGRVADISRDVRAHDRSIDVRRLILKMSVSVDGFVGGLNGEIDWMFESMDEGATTWIVDTLRQAGFHAMGSRTFHGMAAYWPTSTEPFAALMNEIPKVVFSRKGHVALDRRATAAALAESSRRRSDGGDAAPDAPPDLGSWRNAVVANGDIAEEVAWLKRMPGKDILAHGGAGFAQSLIRLNLIDEYRLLVHPVALGSGLALFDALPEPRNFTLMNATSFPAGAIAQVYRTR